LTVESLAVFLQVVQDHLVALALPLAEHAEQEHLVLSIAAFTNADGLEEFLIPHGL
jgi:hypothetical protein